jgi:2-amino-4-hydroxy-6-hydroxymethyldihydropteridine diphosphokinase
MTRAFVALGANLGDRQATIESAVRDLAQIGPVIAVSSIYETDPWGFVDQPAFLNAVAEIDTELPAESVLEFLHEVEGRHGRVRSFANAPRTLDLDLLLYGDSFLKSEHLTVPHPRFRERAFVLVPLAEVAANVVVPGLGATVSDLLDRIEDRSGVRWFAGPVATQ